MIVKVLGLFLTVVGLLILKYFPGITSHQKGGMTMTGLLVGLLLVLFGIGLMIFG